MTTESEASDQYSEELPFRELMPDEVDHRALRMWIQDFLYESPPETDREYEVISWIDDVD